MVLEQLFTLPPAFRFAELFEFVVGTRFWVASDDGLGGNAGIYGGGGSLIVRFDDAEVNVIDDSGGRATVN